MCMGRVSGKVRQYASFKIEQCALVILFIVLAGLITVVAGYLISISQPTTDVRNKLILSFISWIISMIIVSIALRKFKIQY